MTRADRLTAWIRMVDKLPSERREKIATMLDDEDFVRGSVQEKAPLIARRMIVAFEEPELRELAEILASRDPS